MRPYQLRMSVIFVGVGKFFIVSRYLSVGFIPFLVIKNPANSTVSFAN